MTRAPGRLRQLPRAAVGLTATAALLGGLPYTLARLTGSPVPRRLPSWPQMEAALTTPLTDEEIVRGLASAVWLLWAVFALSVIVEAAAAARGRPAPRLPGIAPAQALAAALIGATALTAIPVAHVAPRTVSLDAALTAHAAAGAPGRPGGARPSAAAVTATPPGSARGPGSSQPATASEAATPEPRIHRVAEGDNLWDLAARYLGDGERWPEIYALNQGRPQPGGQELTSPALIQPGWLLRLPPPPGPRPATRPGQARISPPTGLRPAAQGRAPVRPGAVMHRHDRPEPGISLPSGGLAGVSLAAAAAAALVLAGVHRRRRYRPAKAHTSSLEPGPPVPPLITVLRRAAQPRLGAATADSAAGRHGTDPNRGLDATPLGDDGSPHHVAQHAGNRAAGLGSGSATGPEPPGLIALGVRDGAEICVDIAALGGLGLTGPGAPAAARAVLAGLLARAVPGQPGPAEVIVPAADAAVLLPDCRRDDIAGTGIPGLVITASLDAALAEAETIIVRRARAAGWHETGEGLPGGSAAQPPVALIATPALGAAQRLRGVLESGRGTGLAAILLGDWPSGATCHVAADGVITSPDPALDSIRLFHLGDADTTAVISLLQAACAATDPDDDPPSRRSGPTSSWPAADAAPRPKPAPGPARPATSAGGRSDGRGNTPAGPDPAPADGSSGPARAGPEDAAPVPAPAVPGVPQPADVASGPAAGEEPGPANSTSQLPGGVARRVIRIEVLGPLRITARGSEIDGGLRKARELAAFLAVHPGGVTGEAISEALWPESSPGRSASQRKLALRKLRDLLRAAAGLAEPMLITLAGERYRLDPAFISTDVADFQAALDAARAAGNDSARLASCQQAAALYRGPLADGAGYEWAEPYAETARRRALDAWTRIAELLEPAGADQALAALETALGHDPFNEYLYQRIMRLQAAAGRPDAVRRTLRLLETRLSELGVTPGPQTRQAAATLLGTPVPPQPAAAGPPPPRRPAPPARPRPPGRERAR